MGGSSSDQKNIYDAKAKLINGIDFDFESLEGKVVLIVNTASKCGFTPQYKGLEKLYKKYKEKGSDFEILGFPCNQFGGQEPGTDEEINNFCQVNYGVTFPMFEKIDVNGDKPHPLFEYLKEKKYVHPILDLLLSLNNYTNQIKF